MNRLATAPGRSRGNADSPPQKLPFISIIVPVRNEAAFIAGTLEQLFAQDYPADRFEVLVADGVSTDDTRAIVTAYSERQANLRLLDNPRRWSSAGRNVAVRAARGDIILLIDGHCEIDSTRYLTDLADAFHHSGADAVGRPQPLDVSGATRLQRAIALARSSRLGHHPASHIWSDHEGFVPPQSVAVAYRRHVFDQIGPFDEEFDACEDVEFNHRLARAGLTCYFTPRVRVRYHPRDNLGRLFRQMVRYGRGRMRLLRKHPDTLSLSSLVPALFLAGLVLGPLVCFLVPALWAIYLGTLTLYTTLVFGFSAGIAMQQRDLRLLPLLAAVFPAVHLGAGTGLWLEALTGPSRPVAAEELAPTIRSFTDHVRSAPTQPRLVNALTVDVEDYYHVSAFDGIIDRKDWDQFESRVERSTDRLLDCLAAANVRATFFVLGWVAQRHPRLVRSIRSAGHEVGSHGFAHRLIYEQTPEAFRTDLRQSLAVLEAILGEPVRAYRAPSFSITRQSLWALDILAEEGITLDSSIYPTHHDRYGIPGTPTEPHRIECPAGNLWEFPPPVWRCLGYPVPVGGGGYFRLYPYRLTRQALRRINAAGRPFAVYLHPWELDPAQPRLNPGFVRSFRHYVGLRHTEARLDRLLADFSFGTLSEALESIHPGALAPAAPARRAA